MSQPHEKEKLSPPKLLEVAFIGDPVAGSTPTVQPVKTDPKALSIDELRSRYKVDLSLPMQPMPVALEIIGNKFSAPIACYGAVTLVTAKAKSGKTFAHSLLVSALLKGGDLYGRIRPHFITDKPDKRKVVVFDSEQSGYHVQKLGKRIQYLAGVKDSPNLEVWKLRTEPNDVKLQIIEQVIYNDPNISAIVIDGIRDLIFDINSSDEAGIISQKVLKWAEELGIAIIAILHQNKADNNARGHVGTESQNKAEIIVNVTKDKKTDTYAIEAEACRDREFEPIVFKIDEDGIPYIVDDVLPSAPGKKEELLPHQIDDSQHKKVLEAIFSKMSPKYDDLIHAIANGFEQYGCKFGQTKAKKFKTYYEQKGWIAPVKLDGARYQVYRFTQSV